MGWRDDYHRPIQQAGATLKFSKILQRRTCEADIKFFVQLFFKKVGCQRQKGEIEMEKLLKILREACPGVDFENEKALVDDEVLDSMDIVTIVSEIMGAFSIDLNVEDLIPENFNSVEAIMALIEERSS